MEATCRGRDGLWFGKSCNLDPLLLIDKDVAQFVPYPPGRAPSQRFRFEQYLEALTAAGHTYHLAPFISVATWNILYQPGQAALQPDVAGHGPSLIVPLIGTVWLGVAQPEAVEMRTIDNEW